MAKNNISISILQNKYIIILEKTIHCSSHYQPMSSFQNMTQKPGKQFINDYFQQHECEEQATKVCGTWLTKKRKSDQTL